MSESPLLQEEHISQIPALQLVQNLGFVYLRPQEVAVERNGRLGSVLLEGILEKQLAKLNPNTFQEGGAAILGFEHTGRNRRLIDLTRRFVLYDAGEKIDRVKN